MNVQCRIFTDTDEHWRFKLTCNLKLVLQNSGFAPQQRCWHAAVESFDIYCHLADIN